MSIILNMEVQRSASAKKYVNLAKRDPGRARQQEREEDSRIHVHIFLPDLSTCISYHISVASKDKDKIYQKFRSKTLHSFLAVEAKNLKKT